MKHFILLFLLINTFELFSQTEDDKSIKIFQNNKELILNKKNTYLLKKQTFEINFYSKKYIDVTEQFYATSIAFIQKESELLNLNIGAKINEIPFLMAGSGFATNAQNKYSAMNIDSEGHHYLYYENDENRRVDLVKNFRNDYIGKWSITYFIDKNFTEDTKLQKLPYKTLYMVVFNNANLNDTVDENELKVYTLKFY